MRPRTRAPWSPTLPAAWSVRRKAGGEAKRSNSGGYGFGCSQKWFEWLVKTTVFSQRLLAEAPDQRALHRSSRAELRLIPQ